MKGDKIKKVLDSRWTHENVDFSYTYLSVRIGGQSSSLRKTLLEAGGVDFSWTSAWFRYSTCSCKARR
jgi:hypothetical protein